MGGLEECEDQSISRRGQLSGGLNKGERGCSG